MVAAAVRLTEWVGADGIRVTAGGALRPADVADAARAVGTPAPVKVRRAADVPGVHRPWLVAVGVGLIAVSDQRAVQAGKLDDPLATWWSGVQALLAAEVADTFGADPRITAAVTLTVVTEHGRDAGWPLQHRVEQIMRDRGDWTYRAGPQRHGRVHPAEAALSVLRLFGAIKATRLTPLGVWVDSELRRVVPPMITPQLPAKDLLGLLVKVDEVDVWDQASRWFGERSNAQIVDELAAAAAAAPPAERLVAVGLISGLEGAVAAFRAAAERLPNLAAYGRAVAHRYDQAPAPGTEDQVWLATEYAHADLTRHGVTAARYTAVDTLDAAGIDLAAGGIDRIAGSGHPYAAAVAEALAAVAGTVVAVQQLKVSLSGRCWRRVLIPENATLGLLHQVIIALFGWDDDHLHVFTVGHRQYADPYHGLEETASEDSMPLYRVLPSPAAKMTHTYDLGACWRHEIVLEAVLDGHPLPHPECTAGLGDNPIEYYDPDDPQDPEPFDAAAVNNRLRKLTTSRHERWE